MRRMILALTVLGAALVVAPAAVPKPPPSNQDAAFGSGVRAPSCSPGCPAGTFSFKATSGQNGENPSGKFVVDFPGYGGFTGTVTCLHVKGRTATLFGQISTGTGAGDPTSFGAPVYFVAVVQDNGKTKANRPSPDQMSLVGWDTEANWADPAMNPPGFTLAQICSDPLSALGDTTLYGLDSGDLTVIDKKH